MSQHKKKKMKQPTRLRTLVASLMLIAPAIHAANNTEFSQHPLVGVAASFAPHIALALSVEYPTAGAAYAESTLFSTQNTPSSSPATQKYLGYFDNNKCYKYNHVLNAQGNYEEGHDNGYFYPSSMAKSEGGLYGLCNSGSEKEEFSGNMLNYMTMTAIDIFRQAMTGGNRAKGVLRNDHKYTAGYKQGDTVTETFLRRASVQFGQNAQASFLIGDRRLDTFIAANNTNKQNTQATLRRLVPHFFIDVMSADALRGQNTKHIDKNATENAKIYGEPLRMGFYTVGYSPGAKLYAPARETRTTVYAPAQTVTQSPWSKAGQYDKFADPYLHFVNDGFYLQIVRKVTKGVKYDLPANVRGIFDEYHSYSYFDTAGNKKDSGENGLHIVTAKKPNSNEDETYTPEYYAIIDPNDRNVSQHKAEARKWEKRLNVVIKVCDPKSGLDLEENCKPYGNNYKPEGLLQEYTVNNKMRFATFGYLNIGDNSVDGGVLRSRMKWLINDAEESKGGETFNATYGNEWNTTTGEFTINPDAEDARISDVTRSGTINYLNQFGDSSGYKAYDPAAELYNTALTYLRGTHVGNAIYQQSNLTDTAKDGFPVIYNWDDPYKRGIDAKAQHCHPNSIIFIGDTNTHSEAQVTANNPDVGTYTTRLFSNEPDLVNSNANINVGSGGTGVYSPAYMAGLAYWARTNNIRPDLTKDKTGAKPINSSNFIIDVMEKNDAKATPMRNSYYLAAKYGGFTITSNAMENNFLVDGQKVLPKQRNDWTNDVSGTSIQAFTNGVPRNFAIANNPSTMKKALADAMSAGAALNNPSQAATGLSTGLGDIVDVSETGKDYLLQSTYDFAKLTGDVVILKPELKGDRIELTPLKSIGETVTAQYHGSQFNTRKIFTIKDKTVIDFASENASTIFDNNAVTTSGAPSASKLRDYILGDNSLENGTLRQRAGLLGTVINSTATPILKAKNLSSCATQFSEEALKRPIYYTAAANDGMLHIFEEDGREKMAYMAGTALSKLPAFAKIGFQHQYLNDGTPVIQDVCLNDKAQTVLIGTTGRGGNAVYALNVTDLSNPSKDNVMWEFTDNDLGLTLAKPVITKGKDGKQYAIVSSGYHTDGAKPDNGYIFIVDIATGSHSKVKLGKAGVGAPFVYDGDNDGIGDKIFVGDLEGKIWQLDRTDDSANPFAIPTKYNGNPLFTPYQNYVRPITGAPYAEMVNGKLMVIAATGRYFSEADLSTTQENYAYGVIADNEAIVDTNDNSQILPQEIQANITSTTALDTNKVAVYSVTSNQMADTHKGWRLKLIAGANISADSLIRQRQVATFVFSRSTGEINAACVRGANSGLVQVDVRNGGRFSKALVDTNNDGQFDEKDSPDVGMVENIGVNTPNASFFKYRGEDGKIHSMSLSKSGLTADEEAWTPLRDLEAQAGVRRISWREIF